MSIRPQKPAPATPAPGKLPITELAEMKTRRQPIVMVTAYDAPGGRLADEAGADLVLVGDSAAMTVLGHAAETQFTGPPNFSGARPGATVLVLGAGLAGMVAAGVRAKSILAPRKTRYAAPASLIRRNAEVDAASSADSPNAAANVWMTEPAAIPRADAIPAPRPCAMLRPRMNIVSCPGVRFSRMPATRKTPKS